MARATQPLEAYAALSDGARQWRQNGDRTREAHKSVKKCTGCNHWVRLHPLHGPCTAKSMRRGKGMVYCGCSGFVDPEPGRPDRVFTREQIDRLPSPRWRLIKDIIYLMKDGRYGILDEWTDAGKYFVNTARSDENS